MTSSQLVTPSHPHLSTPTTEPPAAKPKLDPASKAFLQLKKQHGMLYGSELGPLVGKLPAPHYLVEGLIPSASVSIMVGDSGIGKSPLAFQLALAVAAGKPFLGQSTRPGKVLLMDYENSLRDAHRILDQQRKHLGLDAYPGLFLFWPVRQQVLDDALAGGLDESLDPVIQQMAPDLVIIDSLRSFNPNMESDNRTAVLQLKKLREIATRHQTAVLLVHHVRKNSVRPFHPLEETPALDWLLRAAGVRALINQTDVRLAVATPSRAPDADLVLRGHYRTHGEIGPYFIRRCSDDGGEPSGYERLYVTVSMLENPEQESAFQKLPESFAFGDARALYGKQGAATMKFLHKLIRLGLLRKTGYGKYQKSASDPERRISPATPPQPAAA